MGRGPSNLGFGKAAHSSLPPHCRGRNTPSRREKARMCHQPRARAPWRERGSGALSPQRLGRDTDREVGPQSCQYSRACQPDSLLLTCGPKATAPPPPGVCETLGPSAAPPPDPLVSICFLAPSPGPCVHLPARDAPLHPELGVTTVPLEKDATTGSEATLGTLDTSPTSAPPAPSLRARRPHQHWGWGSPSRLTAPSGHTWSLEVTVKGKKERLDAAAGHLPTLGGRPGHMAPGPCLPSRWRLPLGPALP